MKSTIINIYALWKNSEDHIAQTLFQFDNLLKLENFKFNLFFFTNDNRDNTFGILQEWKSNYPTLTIEITNETLGAPSFGSVTSNIRTSLLAFFRNKCKKMGEGHPSDYSLVVDTDIRFCNKDFLSLYENLISLPSCVGVAASTIQDNVPDWTENTAPYSHYDLYPFRDKLGNPGCYFSRTPFFLNEDREKFLAGEPVEISSGFGSMAIYNSKAYNKCNYSAPFNSEHIALSYQIRQWGKLFVDPKSTPSTTIDLSTISIDACKKIGADNFKKMWAVNKLQEWSLENEYQFNLS